MLWKSPALLVRTGHGSAHVLRRTGACALLLASAGVPPSSLAANDYTSQCSSCHGPLSSSARRGRSASQIKAAITANRGGMGALRGLSNAELNAIAKELGGSADLPEPSPTPPSSPLPAPPTGSCDGAGSNAKPVVNAIPDQDASVGTELSFTVGAFDCNDVPIIIRASKLKGGSMPVEGQDFDDSGLWSGRYAFTPIPAQANKSFIVKFTAVETEDRHKASTPRQVRIRVFPAGSTFEDGAVTDVKVQSARWSGGKLLVKGRVSFSKALNGNERGALATGGQLVLTDAGGTTEYGRTSVKTNGQWSIRSTLSESSVPCEVAAQFNGESGTPRTVKKAPACPK